MATRSEWASKIREVIDQAVADGYFVQLGSVYDSSLDREIQDLSIYDTKDSSFGVIIFDESDE